MGIKYSVDENFFERWNPKMAYVLGFIYADGNILYDKFSRGSYLSVTSTDKDVIFKIKKWLNSDHSVQQKDGSGYGSKNGKKAYLLRIGNVNLYNSLVKLGLRPNKSLTARMPEVPGKYVKDFVRGYFDGDGCVYIYKSRGRQQEIILRKLSVIFTSGSKQFLEDLLKILKQKLNLRQYIVYSSHNSFQLRLATHDSVEMFKFLYYKTADDLFFTRKFRIFCEYFSLRPQRVDNYIESILRCYKYGQMAKR